MTVNQISLTRPDDWHLHLRDGAALETTVAHSARRFARAIIMPNLKPAVTTTAAAREYRQRIRRNIPDGVSFEPLMTLYLTEAMAVDEVIEASQSGFVHGIKYYPAGATTNSESGVTAIDKVYPILEQMQSSGMPLLIHGEVTTAAVDIFDREKVFIDEILAPLREQFPQLKIVLEHITTREAVQFISEQNEHTAATITVHHLLYNRNHLLAGGVRPHFYCLPVLKRDTHQQALMDAATGGNKKFFLGTDSAPHTKGAKESDCGCAGIYSAPAAIELYAEVFDGCNALDKLEAFAGLNGPNFYGLPRNRQRIELRRQDWSMPEAFAFGGEQVVPIRAGETVRWQLAGLDNTDAP